MTTTQAGAEPDMAAILSATRIAVAAAANDNQPRKPTKIETPLGKCFREDRLTNAQALVAAIVEDEHECYYRRGGILLPSGGGLGFAVQGTQDPAIPIGQEIAADAGRQLYNFRRAADDLWEAVFMATMTRATMEAIGRHYCQPVRRASQEGLRMVCTGLDRINSRCIGLDPLGVDLLVAVNDNTPSVTRERMC